MSKMQSVRLRPSSWPGRSGASWLAVGLAVGLGAGLSCGQSTTTGRPDNWDEFLDGTVIATAADVTISARDLDDRLRLSYTQLYDGHSIDTERSIRDVLKLEMEQILVSTEAERVGFADTSHDFHVYLEGARRNILQQFFITNVLHAEVEPSEEEVRQRYEENKETYAIPRQSVIQHILVATKPEAEAALARVQGGEPFNDVVADVTLDEMNNITGSLGWVREGEEVRGNGDLPGLVSEALAMPLDTYKIVESAKGWHVLYCARYQEAGYRPYEEVREAILDNLRGQRWAVNLDLKTREYRARYGARVYDENLAAYLAWRRFEPESEAWLVAQNATDPAAKVQAYRDFVARFPQSEHTCEARFMIGFTIAEEMNDRNRARIALREFVTNCPDSKLVESAEFMIDDLSSAPGN